MNLPDSRPRHRTGDVQGPLTGPLGDGSVVNYERVYCANCGTDGGLAYNLPHVFYLCDECARAHGSDEALGLRRVPDDVMRPSRCPGCGAITNSAGPGHVCRPKGVL